MTTINEAIDEAHALSLQLPRRISKAADLLYDALDDALLEGRFNEAFEACFYAAETLTDIALLLIVLTITIPWRGKLGPSREAVALKIQQVLAEKGESSRAPSLLQGLWP